MLHNGKELFGIIPACAAGGAKARHQAAALPSQERPGRYPHHAGGPAHGEEARIHFFLIGCEGTIRRSFGEGGIPYSRCGCLTSRTDCFRRDAVAPNGRGLKGDFSGFMPTVNCPARNAQQSGSLAYSKLFLKREGIHVRVFPSRFHGRTCHTFVGVCHRGVEAYVYYK